MDHEVRSNHILKSGRVLDMNNGNITDVSGIKVGNIENMDALTGCTAILAEEGAICGVDVRGSAPGTRETDLLNPINAVDTVHAISLTGGSAYGLEAASGIMNYLEEKGIGLDVDVTRVPIIPSAVLFDLQVGDSSIRPDKKMGYQAAKQATKGSFPFGNVGAGCGATVGKLAGFDNCMKGGLGSASIHLDNGLTVGAIVAVNALGDIRNPNNRHIIAGPIDPNRKTILDSLTLLEKVDADMRFGTNTTIGAVAMNAALSKAEATKVAQVTQNALARTIYPTHTMADGDTIFALATGGKSHSLDLIANMAAHVMEEAILQAVQSAESVANIPSYKSMT